MVTTMNEYLERALNESNLSEKGGRSSMTQPTSIWRKDIENTDDKKLLAFFKKQQKNQTVDTTYWNMLIDELKKRDLKFK